MASEGVHFQDEDAQIHNAWREENESGSVGGGRGSGGSGAGGRHGGRGGGFTQEFFALGQSQSGGSQSHGIGRSHGASSRGGSRGPSRLSEASGSHGGHRGNRTEGHRRGRGSSGSVSRTSVSSTGVHAPPPSPPRPITSALIAATINDSKPSNVEDQRGSKRPAESQGTDPGSGSGSKKKHRRVRSEQRSDEVKAASRALLLAWFEKHDMVYLERQYLNRGEPGLQQARQDLTIILMEGLGGPEFDEDRAKFGKTSWSDWIDQQITEIIHNSTLAYSATYGTSSSISGGPSELYKKLVRWKEGANLAKQKGRATLPVWIEKELADRIATQSREGVVWLPKNATIVAQDTSTFQGTFGVVRRVCIHNASFIPPWIEFAGKTMKAKNNLDNREKRSIEALACPVDHPGIIKLLYLNRNTYESYCLWWNGGSLKNMRSYDKSIAEVHETEILRSPGLDFLARKQLITYRKHRAYLAWALMCIVDVMHKEDVMHNDLNPNNIMLHFPPEDDSRVFIGICDWGMASWSGEDKISNYGKPTEAELAKTKASYICAAPELFHLYGKRGTPQSPMRIGLDHKHTMVSESFSVGVLATKIYHGDSTSNLFQSNRDLSAVKMRFEQALRDLQDRNPETRPKITSVVNTLKSAPYNMETPNMCFRNTAGIKLM
jgi:Protein kinase domain